MKIILFNLHDLVLILVVVFSFSVAIFSVLHSKLKYPSHYLFPILLVLIGLFALDTLLFWGDRIKYSVFSVLPWLLTCFSFASFLIGPVIYWFISVELKSSFKFTPYCHLHLLPAVSTFFYQYWVFYRHPIDIQRELILNFAIYGMPEAHYTTFITFKKLVPLIYVALCIRLFWAGGARNPLSPTFNSKQLAQLTGGLCLLFLWAFLTHICGIWGPLAISDIMGITGNYMMLILIAGIAFIVFQSYLSASILNKDAHTKEADNQQEVIELASRIQAFMISDKPYLKPQMNLERFSKLLDTPPRQVSNAINRRFEKNFQEYINQHRIEEAKTLLQTIVPTELTIIEVAHQSGFNSKATFNRFFKTLTGFTPSTYRAHTKIHSNATSEINTGLNTPKT